MTTPTLDLQDGGTTYDLYDNTNYLVEPPGPDFPPPEKNEIWSGKNILQDGEEFIAKSYGNREISIPLTVLGSTMDGLLTNVRNLEVALQNAERYSANKWGSRVRLKHQPKEATDPVYFDILGGSFKPPKGISRDYSAYAMREASLDLICKPFGYGDEVYLVSGTAIWNHDDSDSGHNMYVDVTGVLGTAPAAARVYALVNSVTTASTTLRVGRRSRGDLSTLIHVSEAEDWTDLSSGGVSGSAACSNAEFWNSLLAADNSALAQKIFQTFTIGQLNGYYHVYARLKVTAATDATLVKLRFQTLTEGYYQNGDTKYITSTQASNWVMFDLGIFSIPHIEVPDDITSIATSCYLQAGADSGAGNWRVQVDYFLFLPADEKFSIVGSTGMAATKLYVLDSTSLRPLAYLADSLTQITTTAVEHKGGFLELYPGVTNRLIFSVDCTISSDKYNLIDDQFKIHVIAKPRYLTVR